MELRGPCMCSDPAQSSSGSMLFEEIGMVRTFRETYVSPQEILSLVAQAQSPSRDPALGISYMDLC